MRAGDVIDGELIDADELIAALADRYQPKAAALGRRIETSRTEGPTASPARCCVEGNWHWLDLALRNLVSNALRYGEGTVTIAPPRPVTASISPSATKALASRPSSSTRPSTGSPAQRPAAPAAAPAWACPWSRQWPRHTEAPQSSRAAA